MYKKCIVLFYSVVLFFHCFNKQVNAQVLYLDQYPGIPIIAHTNMQSDSLKENHFDAMKALGIMGFYAANITPDIYNTITSNGLKLFPYQIDVANNSIVKYTDAIYTKWEAEGKGNGSNGDVQLFHTGIGKDTNEGSTHYIITDSINPGELIYGPGYYQYVKYKQIDDTTDIYYMGNYRMKIKHIGALPDNFRNDTVCVIQIVATNPGYNNDPYPKDKILFTTPITVDTFLTVGWDIWKDVPINQYALSGNGLANLSEQELKAPPGNFPSPYYDTHYMQFKIIWKGLSYLRLCVDYVETFDQRGEALIKKHQKDNDIISLVQAYNHPSNVLGFFGLNEPTSIDNYEPFRYIENLIKGATSDSLHLFTTFTTGWNGTFGGQFADDMNFNVYKGSEFIKRTKLPYISLNTYIYNYPYSPSHPFPNGPWKLRNIVEVTENNLKKLNASSIPFSYSTQSGRFYINDTGTCINQFSDYYINPSPEQMMYHINLGMLYGAKELTCDPLFTLTEKCHSNSVPYRDGLVEVNESGYSLSTLGTTWKNYIKPRMSGLFGQTLKKLTPTDEYPDVDLNIPHNFITSIDADIAGYDLGFFTGQPDIKYFMLLRRWYQTSNPGTVIINFNLNSTGYKNYKLFNYIDSTYSYKNCIDTIHFSSDPGDGKLFSLAPVVLYGGDLNYNETILGTSTLTGDMTIKSGVTFIVAGTYNVNANITVESGATFIISAFGHCNIQTGKTVKFGSNAGMNIYGQLMASGVTFQRNGSEWWGSLIFDGDNAASSVLNNAAILQGNGVQCLNYADILIQNSLFEHCTQGIYIYHSSPRIIDNLIDNPIQYGITGEAWGPSVWIQGNQIIRVTNLYNYQGIYLYHNTNSTLWKNEIRGFLQGGYFGDGCWTGTSGDFFECNNIITGNQIGIATAWGSWTSLGDDDGYRTMSGIYNNSIYDVLTKEESGFVSFYNFFGTNPKIFTDTTTYNYVEFEGNQSTFPCEEQSEQSVNNHVLSGNTLKKSDNSSFLVGLKLEKEGKIDDAINFYKDLIQKDILVKASLSKLAYLEKKYSRPEITDYFQSLLTSQTKYEGKIRNLIGDMYLQNDQFEDAIASYNDVTKNNPTEYEGICARFEKLFAYFHIKNDPSIASKILADIKGLNSKDEDVQMRIIVAENLLNGQNKALGKNVNSTEVNIPKTYELYQNYPNPFNPITTIRYQIPKPGLVTLKVYDILGREVATLVNENKIEGSYDFTFDASRFTSGVYIYQFKVNDYVSSRKMILLK
jgi:tetratricopeptide (TPR) repeat protein